jgi:hypothetical protein
MAQVLAHLPSKHKALNSNPSTNNNNEKNRSVGLSSNPRREAIPVLFLLAEKQTILPEVKKCTICQF